MYYLIESPTKPRWLRLRPAQNGTSYSADIIWTNNSGEALQFKRREDAIAFCYLHPEVAFLATVTEHMDIDREPKP